MFKMIITIRLVIALIVLSIIFVLYHFFYQAETGSDLGTNIDSYRTCVEAGYPILESYPEQCNTPDGRNFVRIVADEDLLVEDVKRMEIVADNLNIPWELAFLPSGEILVNERSGKLLQLKSGKGEVIDQVRHLGEGGLLGMAIHPQYEDNNYLYLYLSTSEDNRVIRYTLVDNQLVFDRIIISGIPVDRFHNGGRIAFGPDGFLYITTGDAQDPQLAQDLNSLAGKILRLDAEGKIPTNNPFKSAVYSYGHRNSQGLAWDNEGRLWSTEHGPTSLDELNLIEAGKNYGWPLITGDEERVGLETSKINSGDGNTWAPSGIIYLDNSLFFAGLRGEALYEARLEGDRVVELKTHFKHVFGRLRNVSLGPDMMFYVLTNNTDGRGDVSEDDDKLIKINPKIFR
jgi:glucose/arabinose dehydrogenase